MDKKLVKSYAFWASVLSAFVAVTIQILRIFNVYIKEELISNVVSSILGALSAVGLISIPVANNAEHDETPEKSEENDEKNNKE